VAAIVVLPGAEPFSAPGGPHGALVVHGFTGCPQSMRGLAEAFSAAGFAVELPRLPGHGTTVEEMATTSWADWSGAAEHVYAELAKRCDKVVVAGLSMGGTITAWLAARHPQIAGIVAINAAVEPPREALLDAVRQMRDQGLQTMPGVANDVADPQQKELAYNVVPLACLFSLFDAMNEVSAQLGKIRCPVLIMNSPQDHMVPPSSSDHLAAHVSGPVERVSLERSYHVATLDYDREEIERRAVEFARSVTA